MIYQNAQYGDDLPHLYYVSLTPNDSYNVYQIPDTGLPTANISDIRGIAILSDDNTVYKLD